LQERFHRKIPVITSDPWDCLMVHRWALDASLLVATAHYRGEDPWREAFFKLLIGLGEQKERYRSPP
jgi:hypothetical protein